MGSVANFCAVLLGGWSIFHLLHNLLLSTTSLGNVVEQYLQSINVSVTLFQVRWFTRRWNKFFYKVGKICELSIWFNAGIIFAFVSMIVSGLLLMHMLVRGIQQLPLFKQEEKIDSTQVLQVIVPGVNLPINDVSYLILSVLLAGILHEFGHAVAAVREGVTVNGFGVFFFLIYPGAYVDLNSEDLARASPLKQLRIYCAGVWHNFILCLLACIFILCLPWIMSPLYSTNGAIVTYQANFSPLRGEKGVEIGDNVMKIGSCMVKDVDSWLDCINKTTHSPQMGSCSSLSEIHQLDTKKDSWSDKNLISNRNCCPSLYSETHLCYSYSVLPEKSFACLPGRVMMLNGDCLSNNDCHRTRREAKEHTDTCVIPVIVDHSTKFTRIVVKRASSFYHVLYYGDPKDLGAYLTVSEYTPRFNFLPLRFPAMVLKFLQYIFSMSGALALLNIVPCYALDGQWAFKAFVEFFCGEPRSKSMRDRVCNAVLSCGTLLVALNVILGLYVVLMR